MIPHAFWAPSDRWICSECHVWICGSSKLDVVAPHEKRVVRGGTFDNTSRLKPTTQLIVGGSGMLRATHWRQGPKCTGRVMSLTKSHDASSSSSALACFRSSVSKPREPAIDRGEEIASLLPLALIAPQPRHVHRRAQLPGLGLLPAGSV